MPPNRRLRLSLTPARLTRVLALPDTVDVAEISLTDDPPGVHLAWDAPGLPDGWTLPRAASTLPRWAPTQPFGIDFATVVVSHPSTGQTWPSRRERRPDREIPAGVVDEFLTTYDEIHTAVSNSVAVETTDARRTATAAALRAALARWLADPDAGEHL